MKQRLFKFFLALMCLLALSGCGESPADALPSEPPAQLEETPVPSDVPAEVPADRPVVPEEVPSERPVGSPSAEHTPAPEKPEPPAPSQTPEAAPPQKDVPEKGTVSAPAGLPENSSFSIHFIDVGQADAALIECDGHYMLIDGGNKEDSNVIYSVLKKANANHLDIVVGTHAHEDHIGGLPGAFNYAAADLTLCPVVSYDSAAFDSFLKYANQKGGGITVPSVGDTYSLGSAGVKILGVNGGEDTNDTSIILMITYGETRFLFTGDAERDAEQAVLSSGADLSSTVLKVGHHGSDTSTEYRFLREIMPQYAVISVGTGNSYGHPTEAALSRLRDAEVKVYRTDLQGDIICTSDGKDVHFSVERNANADTLALPAPKPAPAPQPAPEPAPQPAPEPAPEPEPDPVPDPAPGEVMVWVPKTGKKYHSNSDCSNMKNPSEKPLSQAQAAGYTACSKCW